MSLHGEYDHDNIFAKIIRGEIPSVKVWEDDAVLVFMDAFPQTLGHTLIISKTAPARNLLEIDADSLAAITAAVQRTAIAVEKALKPDGIVVTQFNGSPAGQTVFHLHFHIIPRWDGAEMKGHSHGQMADIAELQDTAAKIRAELA